MHDWNTNHKEVWNILYILNNYFILLKKTIKFNYLLRYIYCTLLIEYTKRQRFTKTNDGLNNNQSNFLKVNILNKKFELWIQLNNEINLLIISFGIFTFAFCCSLFVFHLCCLFLGFCSITLGCCNVRKYEIRCGNSICYLQESPEEIQITDSYFSI